MEELSGKPEVEKLLARYTAVGGVVEFAVLVRGILSPQDMDTHRQAALRTLEVLGKRADERYPHLTQRNAFTDPVHQCFTIRPDLLDGRNISLPVFLGRTFPFLCEQHVLADSGAKETFMNGYAELFPLTEALPEGEWYVPDILEFNNRGFAYAILEPPHGMSVPDGERAALFFSIADELFCGFHCPLTIFQWSTNCSNYFDAGHEWWGSFFWTVEPEGADYIVSIAASSTD